MVSDKIISIWKEKARQGDELARQKLGEIGQSWELSTEHKANVYSNTVHPCNTNPSSSPSPSYNKPKVNHYRPTNFHKTISLRIDSDMLDQVDKLILATEEVHTVTSRSRSLFIRHGIYLAIKEREKEIANRPPRDEVEYILRGSGA